MIKVIDKCPICSKKIEGSANQKKEANYFIHLGKDHDINNGFYQYYKNNK